MDRKHIHQQTIQLVGSALVKPTRPLERKGLQERQYTPQASWKEVLLLQITEQPDRRGDHSELARESLRSLPREREEEGLLIMLNEQEADGEKSSKIEEIGVASPAMDNSSRS